MVGRILKLNPKERISIEDILKQNEFKIEKISSSINKDRFSALEYGLYRVKYYEDKMIKRSKKKNFAQYVFYSPRKRG